MPSLFETTKPRSAREQIHAQLLALNADFLATRPEMVEVACPFCHADAATAAFTLGEMPYVRCSSCASLYNTPRLSQASLARYWDRQPTETVDSDLLPSVRVRRTETIMRPRLEILRARLVALGCRLPVARCMEVGAGIGNFIEVLQEKGIAEQYIAVEPAPACRAPLLRLPHTEIVEANMEDEALARVAPCDLVFINSVIEHPHSLDTFFERVRGALHTGGWLALVDMHSGGFDQELLRGEAQNINPHLILQIGSVDGLRALGARYGLTLRDHFSMGKMDVDIVYDAVCHVPSTHPLHGLTRVLASPELRAELQELLERHGLTGYNGYLFERTA